MKRKGKKKHSIRIEDAVVYVDQNWSVRAGHLTSPPGRRPKTSHLFKYVAEKLPFEALRSVRKYLLGSRKEMNGVYMAHDSMGVARYGGRGSIFARLKNHRRRYKKELVYFSFYIIENKGHEREIENVILRAAGPQMILNQRKVRDGIDPGWVSDYEPGTNFFQRKYARGTKQRRKSARSAIVRRKRSKRRR